MSMSQNHIKEKIKQYEAELAELTKQYNWLVKRSPGRPIHEDAASEYKYFKRQVLEGKLKLTEEILEEYREMVE